MSIITKEEVLEIINKPRPPRKLSIWERIEPNFRMVNHPRLSRIIRKLRSLL